MIRGSHTRCPRRSRRVVAALFGLVATSPSIAADADGDAREPRSLYMVGSAAVSAPEYAGSDQRAVKLHPLLAYQYGRLRIATSRAGALLGFAADAPAVGASAELLNSRGFKLGTALRIDNGRHSSDSPHLAGLPDIERTLRGRLQLSQALGAHWSVGANVTRDLLGRGGGVTAGFDLGYRHALGPRAEWSAGVGMTLADGRYMQTWFGVGDSEAARTGLPAYAPGAGAKDTHAGAGMTIALTPQWLAFASVGRATLRGGAAASPLAFEPTNTQAAFGLAYRCCKQLIRTARTSSAASLAPPSARGGTA